MPCLVICRSELVPPDQSSSLQIRARPCSRSELVPPDQSSSLQIRARMSAIKSAMNLMLWRVRSACTPGSLAFHLQREREGEREREGKGEGEGEG